MTATAPTAPDRARTRPSWRRLTIWGVLFALVLGVTILALGGRGPNTVPLDPDNPEPTGLQGLHRVLEQEGVTIDVARDIDAVESTTLGPQSTLLVVGTGLLSHEATERLLRHAQDAGAVVVLNPQANIDRIFDVPVRTQAVGDHAPREAHCDSPMWRPGDTVVGADLLIDVTDPQNAAVQDACFPPNASYNTGGSLAGHVVTFEATSQRPPLTLVGATQSLTNGAITEGANAAIGLRLLGEREHLVWYIPELSIGPDDGGQAGIFDVLPDVFLPAVAVLALATVMLMFWQGRRLGPVVVEPLPAIIRSSETTESRARMYQRARDRRRALAALQWSARRRLALRLALPATAPAPNVVQAVVDHTGRPAEQVYRLLADPSANSDETLVQIARELRSLEEGMDAR